MMQTRRQISYAILIFVIGTMFFGCKKEDDSVGLPTQILEIAIDTDDKGMINAYLYKARSGEPTALKAMRTANPKRFISLAKRGKYAIDAEAFQFLIIMEGFGNKYAHEAIKSMKK